MKAKRSLEGKMEARERDRERKRRSQLTSNQLDNVRSTERKYQQNKRDKMTEIEKRKAREIRNEKNISVKKRNLQSLKELKNIEKSLRMRNRRSLLSEDEKNIFKHNAKVGMALGRRQGFLRTYKQRKKHPKNNLEIWKNFLNSHNLDLFMMENPKIHHVHEKLLAMQIQVRDDDYKRREKAHMLKMMKTWKGRSVNKKEDCQEVVKSIIKMRKHRKQLKEKINIDFKSMKSEFDSDMDSDQEEIYDY